MGTRTRAELRRRCASFVDVSHRLMVLCGQNAATESPTSALALLIDNSHRVTAAAAARR